MVLLNNYNIPSLVSLNFPTQDFGAIPDPSFENNCIHERMLIAGLRFPFHDIVRDLLYYLQVALFQIIPNGWRYFLATYLLWPTVHLGIK